MIEDKDKDNNNCVNDDNSDNNSRQFLTLCSLFFSAMDGIKINNEDNNSKSEYKYQIQMQLHHQL